MHGFDSHRGLLKMKKPVQIVLITFFIIFLSPLALYAQDFNFKKAFEDYQFSLGVYSDSFSDYQKFKDAYLKNPTLTLKEDARKKTLEMLKSRDELQKVYLTALRMRLVENNGLTTDEKVSLFTKIDSEVAWYLNHKGGYQDGDTLETLFNKSGEAESRYKSNTSQIVYESLFYISLGDEVDLRVTQEAIYKNLTDTINIGVAEGKLDINPFNRWFLDIADVIGKLKANEVLSKTSIQKMYGQSTGSPTSAYNSSLVPLTSSIKLLSQFNSFLIEVLTSIKNQQK